MNIYLIILCKIFSALSRFLNLGNGSTWPGHIALKANKNFIKQVLSHSQTKIILIAGTNGKTTTSKIIRTILEKAEKKVLQNQSGANLLNGIASTLILNSSTSGKLKQEYAIFEVDENALPLILNQVIPDYLVILNLFRDQLDRYGEVNTIAKKWQTAINKLSEKTQIILNSDDPQVAYLGIENPKTLYFGLNKLNSNHLQHAADSVYCPRCGEKLSFKSVIYSHLGDWHCKACGLDKPKIDISETPFYPFEGMYNKYNTLAAVLTLKQLGLSYKQIEEGLKLVKPAFGRQEVVMYKNKKVQLFLSKNPTSFNQSYETIRKLGAKILLIVLNDRIPDGRDVSWIWDVDFPGINNFKQILISGDRVYDMVLRIKYENYTNPRAFDDLTEAIENGFGLINQDETLYILPTYSAMLDVRKILTGKKIL